MDDREKLEDMELVDDLDDFELNTNPAIYEIWLLGYDENNRATDFELYIDGEYRDITEAQKCFDYFADPDNLKDYLQLKHIEIPKDTKHVHLFLESVIKDFDIMECDDVLDEAEVEII